MSEIPGVTKVETDKSKLQATFTYDDEKVTLEKICENLTAKSGGRYKPDLPKTQP